jgi:hypothetical protein
MKNGRQSRDEQFITAELAIAIQRAQMLEDSGNVYFAWQNFHETSNLFQGLTDTKKIDEHVAVLEKSVAVMEGREGEEKEIAEQVRLQDKVLKMAELIVNPNSRWLNNEHLNNDNRDERTQVRDVIRRLRKDLEDKDRPERRWALERTRGSIFAYLMETGRSAMDADHLEIAKTFFEFATEAQPNMSWPHIFLARCLVRIGEKEESIQELGRAREVGLSAQALADMSKQIPELSSLIDDPEFQRLITDVPSGH